MRLAFALSLSLVLTACAGLPQTLNSGSAERPASAKPANSDAQQAAKVHVELGSAYFQSGRFGVALDEARIAQAFDPNYAPTYHLFGQVYMYLDDADAARRNFEQAARLAPGDPEIDNTYGWFLCSSGHEQEGLARLLSSSRNPYYTTPTRPLTNAGLCHLRLKDDAAAEPLFQRAVAADPKNTVALFHLAAIAYRRGAFELAQTRLEAVHALAEPAPDSLWLGILIARKAGHRDSELTYVSQLRSRYPTSREYEKYSKGEFE